MLNINKKLADLEVSGKKIRVGLLGLGQMGTSMAMQMIRMKGIQPAILCDRNPERFIKKLLEKGFSHLDFLVTDNANDSQIAIECNKIVITQRIELLWETPAVDIVVDATGAPETGAIVGYQSINHGKDIVMLNVEADITVGAYLSKIAQSAGVVYTGSAGDEPGAIKELYDFADGLGFDVLVCGKGKNNPLNPWATPDELQSEADLKGVNPKMLTSFVDGTKTMVEMACVANATGFLPDIPGMHGVKASVKELNGFYKTKAEGGILNNYKIVDFASGVAPGVFIIFSTEEIVLRNVLGYVSMGPGPNYTLYRPYHLTSIETPLSVARAYFYREPTIAPLGNLVAETVAVAKKDLKQGEYFDHIGGFTCYGSLVTSEAKNKDDLLPIGLVDEKTKVARDIKKGELIKYSDVILNEGSFIVKLRKMQEDYFIKEC